MVYLKKKDIEYIIDNARDYSPSDEDIIIIGNLADEYEGKTEEDIFVEIIRINNQMEESMSEEQYQAIFEKIDAMRSMFSEEQNEKLDRVLELLNKNK